MAREVADDRREHTDQRERHEEASPASRVLGRRHACAYELPGQREQPYHRRAHRAVIGQLHGLLELCAVRARAQLGHRLLLQAEVEQLHRLVDFRDALRVGVHVCDGEDRGAALAADTIFDEANRLLAHAPRGRREHNLELVGAVVHARVDELHLDHLLDDALLEHELARSGYVAQARDRAAIARFPQARYRPFAAVRAHHFQSRALRALRDLDLA